eukprot:1329689-Amphidinium_carterae.1
MQALQGASKSLVKLRMCPWKTIMGSSHESSIRALPGAVRPHMMSVRNEYQSLPAPEDMGTVVVVVDDDDIVL